MIILRKYAEAGEFAELVEDIRALLVGLELTEDEGRALIDEVRKVTRRPPDSEKT